MLSLHLSLVRVSFHLHPLVVPHSFALGTQPTFLGQAWNNKKLVLYCDHYCMFGLPPACWHQPFPTNPYPSCPHMPILRKQLPTESSEHVVVDRERSLEEVQQDGQKNTAAGGATSSLVPQQHFFQEREVMKTGTELESKHRKARTHVIKAIAETSNVQ